MDIFTTIRVRQCSLVLLYVFVALCLATISSLVLSALFQTPWLGCRQSAAAAAATNGTRVNYGLCMASGLLNVLAVCVVIGVFVLVRDSYHKYFGEEAEEVQ